MQTYSSGGTGIHVPWCPQGCLEQTSNPDNESLDEYKVDLAMVVEATINAIKAITRETKCMTHPTLLLNLSSLTGKEIEIDKK